VKATMIREAETKFVSDYDPDTANTYTTFNSQILGTNQWALGICPLSQATGQVNAYTRVGDEIMPRQVKVALDIRLKAQNPANPIPVDVVCVVYYGYCKTYSKYDDVDANSTQLCSELLRLGGVTTGGAENIPFNGNRSDSHLLVNTDTWKLKKIEFRLHKAAGLINGSAGAGTPSSQTKYGHSLMLDFMPLCPSEKLKYDTSQDTKPANWSPVWSCGYYYTDNTAPDTGTNGILEYKATRYLTFKDF